MSIFDLFRRKTDKNTINESKPVIGTYASKKISPPATPFVIEKDRFDPDKLLRAWQEADKGVETILVDDIEVVDYQECFDTMMQSFWKNICKIDNYIQNYCVDELNVKTEAWKVDLVWLSTKECELELAYWGVYMNIELTAVCKYHDGDWNVTEVYYC